MLNKNVKFSITNDKKIWDFLDLIQLDNDWLKIV